FIAGDAFVVQRHHNISFTAGNQLISNRVSDLNRVSESDAFNAGWVDQHRGFLGHGAHESNLGSVQLRDAIRRQRWGAALNLAPSHSKSESSVTRPVKSP